jgi:hypothetical protein
MPSTRAQSATANPSYMGMPAVHCKAWFANMQP